MRYKQKTKKKKRRNTFTCVTTETQYSRKRREIRHEFYIITRLNMITTISCNIDLVGSPRYLYIVISRDLLLL